MAWAYIFLCKSSKFDIISTENIRDFDEHEYLQQKPMERRRKIYKATIEGKKRKFQVLLINDDRQTLERESKKKRVPIPKLNASDMNDTSEGIDDETKDAETEGIQTKAARKELKKLTQGAKTARADDIVAAHLSTASNFYDEAMDSFSDDSPPPDYGRQPMLPKDQDELEIRNQRIIQLENTVAKLEETVHELKTKLNSQKRKASPVRGHRLNFDVDDDLDDDTVQIGRGIHVKKIALDEAERTQDPSKFIGTLCRAIWATEDLARKTTRLKKGLDRELFSPEKKAAVSRCFTKWLGKNFSDERAKIEEQRINSYYNRVTEYARKKIKKDEQA